MSAALLALAAAFYLEVWGNPAPPVPIPLVDTNFISTATARMSAAEVLSSGGDASGLDCYACHEKSKPPKAKTPPKKEKSGEPKSGDDGESGEDTGEESEESEESESKPKKSKSKSSEEEESEEEEVQGVH